MTQRVAEHVVRRRRFGSQEVLRVDLHGVSHLGPGGERAVIRWEWIEEVVVDGASVVVRSATEAITLPPGSFGAKAPDLAADLIKARSIADRPDVIERLGGGGDAPG